MGFSERRRGDGRGAAAARDGAFQFGTLTFLFSIDGGTSGLASALLQGARDDYPTSRCSAWLYLGAAWAADGRVQRRLALHQLTNYARRSGATTPATRPPKSRTWPARDLAGLFLPRVQDNIERQFCGQRDVVLRCCTSLPFCDVRSTLSRPVKKSDDWPKLASRLAEAFPKADLLDRPLVACQATAVARGVVDASPLPLSMLRKRLAPDARRAPPGCIIRVPRPVSILS